MFKEELYLYGISRVDRGGEHYWVVRLHYVHQKPTKYGIFYDNTYKGVFQSFAAAVSFRDSNVKQELIKYNPYEPYLENSAKETCRSESWKKERIKRRLKTIQKYGRKDIYVGTGVEAAKTARRYGASKVTCWKIKSGKQDYYRVWSWMPGINFNWKERPSHRRADMGIQKKNGKKKNILGIGREAAIKAFELGASAGVCLKILHGKQNFFNCCHGISHFEANGFKRELTQDIVDKIKQITADYVKKWPLEVASEVILNYASRDSIPSDEGFIKSLVLKYKNILERNNSGSYLRGKKIRSLDINGDIERFGDDGDRRSGKGIGKEVL